MEFYRIVTEAFGLRERTRSIQLFNCNRKEFIVLDLVTSYPLKRSVIGLSEHMVYRLKFEDDYNTFSMILHCSVYNVDNKFVYVLIDEDKKDQYFVVSVDV
jgi:hypothetical protein